MTVSRLPIPTEHQEQVALFRWAWLQRTHYPDLCWLYAIPNAGGYKGGFATNAARVQWMLAEGLKPGYPDIGLDVARGSYHGCRLELKRTRDSKFSDEQAAWRDRLLAQGYQWVLCFGWERARDSLLEYLALPHP